MTMNDKLQAYLERRSTSLEKAIKANRQAVFDALANTGLSSVTAEFDGEGDSGDISVVSGYVGDEPVELPTCSLTIKQAFGDDAVSETASLREAILTLCLDLLEAGHGGWEIDEGSYGEFRLDVAARTVKLEFNERYESVETSHHEL